MAHRHDAGSGSLHKRATSAVLAEYTARLAEQALTSRTPEAYLAAVTAFLT